MLAYGRDMLTKPIVSSQNQSKYKYPNSASCDVVHLVVPIRYGRHLTQFLK